MPCQHGRKQQSAAVRVEAAQVIAAVESLYQDRVQPHGRILLKRLGERMAAAAMANAASFDAAGLKCLRGRSGAGEVVPRIDTAHLRRVCERSKLMRTVPEDAGDYSVFLVRRQANFVDACSEWDCFEERFWESARAYFRAGGAGQRADLPGGRYACARALQALSPPFLAGCVLGEVCHAVQLAISHKKILGYLDGRIVPYRNCELVVKQQSAELQQPAWALKKDTLPVADLQLAQQHLRTILASAQCEERGGIPMPNIKRLFRSQFGCELMETVFGHARLCDLLSSEAFSHICELRLQSSTYIVVPRAPRVEQNAAPLPKGEQEEIAFWQPSVLRTFLHLPEIAPGTARCKSLPRDWKLDACSHIASCKVRHCSLTPRAVRRLHAAQEEDTKAESSDEETTASDLVPKDFSSSCDVSDDESASICTAEEQPSVVLRALTMLQRSEASLCTRTPSPSPSPRRGSCWQVSPLARSLELPASACGSSSSAACRTPSHSPRYNWRGEASPASLVSTMSPTSMATPASSVLSTMPVLPPVIRQPLDLCNALGLPSSTAPPSHSPVLPACLQASTMLQPPDFPSSLSWADCE